MNNELQHGSCTTFLQDPRDVLKKIRRRSSTEGLIHEQERPRSRRARNYSEVQRILCTITTANDSILVTEEAAVYVKDLDTFITVQLLEDSLAVYLRKYANQMRILMNGRKDNGPH